VGPRATIGCRAAQGDARLEHLAVLHLPPAAEGGPLVLRTPLCLGAALAVTFGTFLFAAVPAWPAALRGPYGQSRSRALTAPAPAIGCAEVTGAPPCSGAPALK